VTCDKSRVELTVLLVCRWILARLRHQRFFSLEELNGAIRPLLTDLNNRPFQRLPGSRRSVFDALDRPAMRDLPLSPYVFAEWKERTVAFDYHGRAYAPGVTVAPDSACRCRWCRR
jgi:hypothetical protein